MPKTKEQGRLAAKIANKVGQQQQPDPNAATNEEIRANVQKWIQGGGKRRHGFTPPPARPQRRRPIAPLKEREYPDRQPAKKIEPMEYDERTIA